MGLVLTNVHRISYCISWGFDCILVCPVFVTPVLVMVRDRAGVLVMVRDSAGVGDLLTRLEQ